MDATLLDTFQTCECKYDYRFNQLRVTEEQAKPLDRGGLIHYGEEAYWTSLKSDPGKWELAVDRGLLSIRRTAAEKSDLSNDEITVILDKVEESFRVWRAKDISLEILEVERPFMFTLYEDEKFRLILIGKIDLLVNDYPNYMNLPIDHKSYERDFPLRRNTNQFTLYSYAMQSNYLMVNRIGMADSIGVGTRRSKDPADRHKRPILSYDKLFWDTWKKETVEWMFKYYECIRTGTWLRNRTSCDKFNRKCEYLEQVCDRSGEESQRQALASFYKQGEKWDVSSVLAKKG